MYRVYDLQYGTVPRVRAEMPYRCEVETGVEIKPGTRRSGPHIHPTMVDAKWPEYRELIPRREEYGSSREAS